MEQVLSDVLNEVEQPEAAEQPVVEDVPPVDEPTDTGETTTPPVDEQPDQKEKGFQAALLDERRKRQAIERELEELRNAAKPQTQAKPDEAPNPAEFAGGEYDPAYIAAVSRYEARQEFARVRNEEAEAQRRFTQEQRLNSVEMAGRNKYPDYDQAIAGLVNSGVRFSDAAIEVISESELGHEMSYLLAKNPQAAFEFSRLSPSAQARELGKLEMRMQMQIQAPQPAHTPQPKPEVPQTLTQQRDTRGQFVKADSGPPSLESILS